MWTLSLPWWEFVLRAAIVYVFLLILLRLTGKRQVAQITPFDLVLLLVLSNAVQNSMNGGDNSALGEMISAVTLIVLNYLVAYATQRSRRIEILIEGRPEVLARDGKLYWDVMRRSHCHGAGVAGGRARTGLREYRTHPSGDTRKQRAHQHLPKQYRPA